MYKVFPKGYWLCWLGAAAFFVAIFPYGLIGDRNMVPAYFVFCVILNAISTVLLRAIALRIWVKRFYSESFRIFGWFLAITAFCHLVFLRMHPMGGICIGLSGMILVYMAFISWKEWKQRRSER